MDSDEFRQRFRHHPLGHTFQRMEVFESLAEIQSAVGMAMGMFYLLDFQGDITTQEYRFLEEARKGNAKRNLRRINVTTSQGTTTQQ